MPVEAQLLLLVIVLHENTKVGCIYWKHFHSNILYKEFRVQSRDNFEENIARVLPVGK